MENNIFRIKQKIAQLIEEKGLNPNSLSLQIGYERSYLNQFINRDKPKRLSKRARKNLAIILEVPEQELTDEDLSLLPDPLPIAGIKLGYETLSKAFNNKQPKDTVSIDMLSTTACCGSGSDFVDENIIGKWMLPIPDFRQLTYSTPQNIKMIRVVGDSMNPTLKDGDWVFVDLSQKEITIDGIYLIRLSTGLAVKRIQSGIGENIIILSDNPKYQALNVSISEAEIVGKIIHAFKSEKVG